MERPRAYTPDHLAQKILRSRSALAGERKQVTVFFVDVKQSMRLAAGMDAEEWHGILSRFFAILADGVHRFEGTINQYTGDGIMALFGAPIAHEDHARRACHAALYLREQLRVFAQELRRTRGVPFAVRMGLNSGEVVVGAIGDDLRMDYTAQGHTVGLAARMQQIADPGRIYLTAETATLVGDFFELEPVGRVRVKGAREPLRTYALAGAGRVRTRIEASRARGFSPFVGRADEVAVLEAALSRAACGYGQVVSVVGAAGVGKSRLCQDAIDRWRAEGLTIAEAHCPSHGKVLPYAVLFELLRSLAAITPGARPAASRRRLASFLRRLHAAGDEDFALVRDALGLSDSGPPSAALPPDVRRERLFGLACRLVQAQSAHETTVLLIDDVQWIDPESDAFLARLVEAVGWTRTLLLLNARPDHAVSWSSVSYHRQIALSALDADASAALVRDLVGEDPSTARFCDLINEQAGGNPFFIEEIVQSLVDQGVLVRESPGAGRQLRAGRPVGEIRIPATVQSLLAARIDALTEPAKHVLQTAAVVGKRFSEPVLRLTLGNDATSGFTGDDVAEILRALRDADLVRSERSAEYTFKHPLTQEVAYQSQLQEARARRHVAVARAIEVVHADRLGEVSALLAHHWETAGQRHEAQRWRRRAALQVTSIHVRRGGTMGRV